MKKYEQQSIKLHLNDEIEYESHAIVETDNLGREKFWEDIGRPENE